MGEGDRSMLVIPAAQADRDAGIREAWRAAVAGEDEPEPGTQRAIHGVVVGTVAAVDSTGGARVDFPGNPAGGALLARAAVSLGAEDVGREVALLFEGGNPRRPLVMGRMEPARTVDGEPVRAEVDGGRLVLTAEREIVLRCGEASITLTRAGKVLVRGAYLLSRSSGVNRIRGGSVQIN